MQRPLVLAAPTALALLAAGCLGHATSVPDRGSSAAAHYDVAGARSCVRRHAVPLAAGTAGARAFVFAADRGVVIEPAVVAFAYGHAAAHAALDRELHAARDRHALDGVPPREYGGRGDAAYAILATLTNRRLQQRFHVSTAELHRIAIGLRARVRASIDTCLRGSRR